MRLFAVVAIAAIAAVDALRAAAEPRYITVFGSQNGFARHLLCSVS